MSTDSKLPNVPQMHAETGYEEPEYRTPFRISGFLCLLVGLVSVLAVYGKPLLIFPATAFALGMIALRRTGEGETGMRPIGTTPAMIGMVLATGFGVYGFCLPWFKDATLGAQAEKFGRDYIEVIARGDDYFAIELGKDYANRFPTTMDLGQHYALSEQGEKILDEFQKSPVVDIVRGGKGQSQWVLDRSAHIYYSYKREHAELIWRDAGGGTTAKIHMFLDYLVDSRGNGQWHIEECTVLSPRYTAPAIL
ncbi:MAG: hypothetical protein P8L85_20605 [Rubripirellula sp.]|nr:hypothetical protein [Rubripirellula sp.]